MTKFIHICVIQVHPHQSFWISLRKNQFRCSTRFRMTPVDARPHHTLYIFWDNDIIAGDITRQTSCGDCRRGVWHHIICEYYDNDIIGIDITNQIFLILKSVSRCTVYRCLVQIPFHNKILRDCSFAFEKISHSLLNWIWPNTPWTRRRPSAHCVKLS